MRNRQIVWASIIAVILIAIIGTTALAMTSHNSWTRVCYGTLEIKPYHGGHIIYCKDNYKSEDYAYPPPHQFGGATGTPLPTIERPLPTVPPELLP